MIDFSTRRCKDRCGEMMELLVGIGGPVRAGKTAILEKMSFWGPTVVTVNLGSIVKRHVRVDDGVVASRSDYSAAAVRLYEERGMQAPVDIALDELDVDSSSIVVLDGLRNVSQWNYAKRVSSCPCVLLYVDASLHDRFQRMRQAARFPEDASMTLQEFWWAEKSQITEALIPELRSEADLYVNNDGTLERWLASAESLLGGCLWMASR